MCYKTNFVRRKQFIYNNECNQKLPNIYVMTKWMENNN